MNKALYIFLILTIILSVGCQKQKPLVGFMLPHMKNKRYVIEKESFTKKISELGGETIFYSADNDEERQLNQLDSLIKSGIRILVLDPVNRFGAASMVRKAHENGIKVISYDRLISNCQPDAFLTFDSREIGRQMAEYAVKLRPKGNIVVLGGDKRDVNATWIREGQMKVIEPFVKSGQYKIVYEEFLEGWSESDANMALNDYLILSQNIPDIILSGGDLMSKGAIDALKKNKVEANIVITGQGAEPVACKAILQGKQSMTVYKPAHKMATLAAELAFNILNDSDIKLILDKSANNGSFDIPSHFVETVVVDATNIRSVVMADGMVTEKELQ